ncbi:hypothetical protein NUACC21_48290 [Scytonema sp. NUACC21]
MKLINYYQELSANYSKLELVDNELALKLLNDAEEYICLREETLPEITPNYSLVQIEQENKSWWPTHCEAQRQGRGDILAGEYTDPLIYFCADGSFDSREEVTNIELHWWAITAQPGVRMVWPLVMFRGEFIYSEWMCINKETNESIAQGNMFLLRRGHRGGCYLKCHSLTFYRNIRAADELFEWLRL